MHEALRISEIMAIIMGNLTKRALAQCARVCHSWFLACIEVIWETIMIPSDLRGLLMNSRLLLESPEWEFSRVPSQKEWDRIYLYTSKARSLDYSRRPNSDPTSNWLTTFLHPLHSNGGPLFPRVHTFSYWSAREEDDSFCNSLISQTPSLTAICTPPTPSTQQAIGGLCAAIRTASLDLTNIYLRGGLAPSQAGASDTDPDGPWRELSIVLQSCPRLESFMTGGQVTFTPQIILEILGTLPRVKHVWGRFPNWSGGGQNPDAFPSLERLSLFGLRSGKLFREEWFPPLPLRDLVLHTDGEVVLFPEVLEKVSSRGHSLETFQVSQLRSISSSNIHGLGNHRRLRHLALQAVGNVTLKDEDMEHLFAGLPELEEFKLFINSPPCYLTLLSISHFTRLCNNITHIDIPLIIPTIPTIPALPTSTSSRCVKSVYLDLMEPQQFDTIAVANFLYRCFSKQHDHPWIGSRASQRKRWAKVNQLVEALFISRDATHQQ